MKSCPSGKIRRDEKYAKIKAKKFGNDAYKCPDCGAWHLTGIFKRAKLTHPKK